VTGGQILTVLSVVLGGSFIGALVQLYRAKPDRDSVIISATKNASEVLQGLNTALYTELERERENVKRIRAESNSWEDYSGKLEKFIRENNLDPPTEGRPG